MLARNQPLHFSSNPDGPDLRAATQSIHLIAPIQAEVMKTRLQPIRKVWKKFPRTVRDLSDS
jgi:two-component system, chemotaxis family, sensor kinase CheA